MKEKIGEVGVDSGMLVICDPCYITNDKKKEKELNDYDLLLSKIDDKHTNQLNYDHGHPGLGVRFDTMVGDGTFDVFSIKDDDGNLKKIEIVLRE